MLEKILMLLGRFSISIVFLLSAVLKVVDYDSTAELMASKGMVIIPFFLYGAAILEFMGGISLLIGCRTRLGAGFLLIFLVPVTYIFHDFWILEGAARQMQMILFAKNLAIFGGLLYIISCGGGICSVDDLFSRNKNKMVE